MCGLFGVIGNKLVSSSDIVHTLIDNAESRGRDAAGALVLQNNSVSIYRADERAKKLFNKIDVSKSNMLLGHSRLITNGFTDNQPIFRDGIVVYNTSEKNTAIGLRNYCYNIC